MCHRLEMVILHTEGTANNFFSHGLTSGQVGRVAKHRLEDSAFSTRGSRLARAAFIHAPIAAR
jgi:hypothetical protein